MVVCVIFLVQNFTSPGMKQLIYATIEAIVLESVGGLILLRIFKKIYTVVKDRDESNA